MWITEIHYNPAGTDSGYEWVEWWNDSNEIVDLASYKFRENGVNHGLKEYRGGVELGPDERTVIADNPAKFVESFPEYTGMIIDSAFSLNNTGELLEVINPNGTVVFEVTYDAQTGGDGNAASIGLLGDVWYEVSASPGEENVRFVSEKDSQGVHTDTNTTPEAQTVEVPVSLIDNTAPTQVEVDSSPATYIEIKNPTYQEKTIKTNAGGDRTVMAGASYWFRGTVYGLQGGLIEDPEIRWNWGDGTTGSGPQDRHTYRYPGVYTLTMSAVVQNYSSRDRALVTVIPPALALSSERLDGARVVTLANESLYHLEVSGYRISNGYEEFVFPEETFVNAGATMRLEREVLGIEIATFDELFLIDVSDQLVSRHSLTQQALEEQVVALQYQQQEVLTNEAQEDQETETDIRTPLTGSTHSVVYLASEQESDHGDSDNEHEDTQVLTQGLRPERYESTGQEALMFTHSRETQSWHWWVGGVLVVVLLGLYAWGRLGEISRRDELENEIEQR